MTQAAKGGMLAVFPAATKEQDKCRALLLWLATDVGKPWHEPHTRSGFLSLTLKGFKKCLLESSFCFSSRQGSSEGQKCGICTTRTPTRHKRCRQIT